MRRGGIVGLAGLLVLATSSCAAPSIEEMRRNAIREQAAEGKAWFTWFAETTDNSNRELVASRLEGQSFGHYAYGWDPDGDSYTEHYYREHVTTSAPSAPASGTRWSWDRRLRHP